MRQSETVRNPELAALRECTGCLACKDSCPVHAIDSYLGGDGHVYVKINPEQCIHCHKCEQVCQQVRKAYGSNDLGLSRIYAAWAQNADYRKNGTSGGIFAALAHKILSDGGSVVGASFDGRNCRHVVIQDLKEISKLQGSKYVHSSMEGIYKEIEGCLKTGDVLFTGVGCQCAGVLGYFENKKLENRLYTVDLVCGGAPSRILLDKFFAHNPDVSRIASFRSKDQYALQVWKQDKLVPYPEKSLPLHGFNCGMTDRYSCYDCRYAKAHRKTDVTIGDLWDYRLFPEEHSKGISMVIVHSEKGQALFHSSETVCHEIPWEGPLSKNKRTVWGKAPIFWPRRNLEKMSAAMEYDRFVKLYCITMKPKDIGLFLFRVYRYLVMKANKYIAQFHIRLLLKR